MSIKLRLTKKTDYAAIVELLLSCGLLSSRKGWFTRSRYLKMLARNKGLYWLAVDGRKIVGTVFGCEDGGHLGYIYKLGVDPLYRGQGIAEKLLKKILALFEKRRIVWKFAFSKKSNKTVNALFKKFGFETINNSYHAFSLS